MTDASLTPEVYGDFDKHLADIAAQRAADRPEVVDDEKHTVLVVWCGKCVKTWDYETEAERRRGLMRAYEYRDGINLGAGL